MWHPFQLRQYNATKTAKHRIFILFDLGPAPAGTLGDLHSLQSLATDLASIHHLKIITQRVLPCPLRSVSFFDPSFCHCCWDKSCWRKMQTWPINRFCLLSTILCRLSAFVLSNRSSFLMRDKCKNAQILNTWFSHSYRELSYLPERYVQLKCPGLKLLAPQTWNYNHKLFIIPIACCTDCSVS